MLDVIIEEEVVIQIIIEDIKYLTFVQVALHGFQRNTDYNDSYTLKD